MVRRKKREDSTSDATRQRAWRAVKEFRKLATGLNAYARAVTGNPAVKVLATEGDTMTDGVRIFIRPPIELGDDIPHNRGLCGDRGEDRRQLCRACEVREMALAGVFHEIAHIVFGSRVAPNDEGISAIRNLIHEWHPPKVCDHAQAIFGTWKRDWSYLDYGASFGEVLAVMMNSLEDSRVNAAQFRARPGTRTIMEINLYEIFESGVGGLGLDDAPEGAEPDRWQDRSFPWQLMVGLFLEASDYHDLTDTLDPRVGKILRAPDMAKVLARVSSCEDVHALTVATCDVFRLLAESGALDMPKCEPPPPPPPAPPVPDEESSEEDKQESEPKPGDDQDDGDGDNDSHDNNDDQPPDEDAGGEFGKSEQGTAQSKEQDDTSTGEPGDSTTSGSSGGEGEAPDDQEQDDSSSGDDQEAGSGSTQDVPGGRADDDNEGGDEHQEDSGSEESGSDNTGAPDSSEAAEGSTPPASGGDVEESDERPEADDTESPGGDARPGEGDGEDSDDTAGSDDADGSGSTPGKAGDGEEGVDEQEAQPSESDPGRDRPGDSEAGADEGGSDGREVHDAAEPDGTDGEEGGERPLVRDDYEPTEQDGETDYDAAPVPEAPGDDESSASDSPVGESDEADEIDDPITPISVEELLDALKNISLHHILGPRKDFATGDNDACPGDPVAIDPAEGLFGEDEAAAAIAVALLQASFFDTSSRDVGAVKIINYGALEHMWVDRYPIDMFKPAESAISRSVHEARILFDANARGRKLVNLRSGKVDGRNLAKRVPQNDPRMFRKNVLPKRVDYKIFMTADISGSTASADRISRIKRSLYGNGEMLHRVGVPFEMWAHSAGYNPDSEQTMLDLWMYHVKSLAEPWNKEIKKRLADMRPQAGNLDGHTLEFLRKRAQAASATNKIILYYTDGAMPAANYAEELEILQREIKICRQEGIALLAVGIDTDSPEAYGFRTCQVDSDSDLPKVIKMLKDQMTA